MLRSIPEMLWLHQNNQQTRSKIFLMLILERPGRIIGLDYFKKFKSSVLVNFGHPLVVSLPSSRTERSYKLHKFVNFDQQK